jgi:ComF family protein
LGSYRDELRRAVLQMKRAGSEPLAVAIGGLLVHTLEAPLRELQPDVIVPIPMHWSRRFARGINGPEMLAAAMGRRLRLPVAPRALVRRRATRPQSELLPEDRANNLRGAFRLAAQRKVRGRRILLVDDVLTTGTTVNEAAKVLLGGGAAAVAVAIVARADGAAKLGGVSR